MGRNVGSRNYLMDTEDTYKLFKLKNKEFTYTVDDSQLDCGLNGALYFVQMEADGGAGKYGNAGAKYGLGYCDAQCLLLCSDSCGHLLVLEAKAVPSFQKQILFATVRCCDPSSHIGHTLYQDKDPPWLCYIIFFKASF